jgi:hypothetical protein
VIVRCNRAPEDHPDPEDDRRGEQQPHPRRPPWHAARCAPAGRSADCGFAPQATAAAGKAKTAATGKGNPWLAATLGEIAVTAGRTTTFLGERYRRIAKRRGKQRALVAVGNSVLTIVWHLLADSDAHYHDLAHAVAGPQRQGPVG